MDLHEAIQKRYSVRKYDQRPVEDEKLRRVLEAGIAAPTARNRQELKFIVVRDAETRTLLAEATEQAFIAESPVIIAVVGLTPHAVMHCGIPTDPVDCAIAIDHMSLTAVAEGLGTCWLGHFDQSACRTVLSVPQEAKIVAMLAIGYSADKPKPKKRKDFAQLVCYDKFQK